ncbi:MAG: NAD+ synthase [Desulfotalea sp.]|nr:MAG: NAD+ synthase [Desulfotalea sp.]
MKIGLVQVNPVIGDFKYNCERILKWSVRAKNLGCDLVIFPELVISGYPPQDLLERQSFVEDHNSALNELMGQLPELDVMLGCFEENNLPQGKPLYNSAIVVRKGEVVFRTRKQLLPTYDVFDETRYFQPGESSDIYTLGDAHFGVTVCEDVWSETVHDYRVKPVAALIEKAAKEGLTLNGIINISASPFQRKKEEVRKSIFKSFCEQYKVPFLYCNQVGGQDSLLFDGRSFAIDASGDICAQAAGFKEDCIVVDTETWKGDISAPVDIKEEEAVYNGLVMGVKDYVTKCGFSSIVLGLSGGIDSALTAVIAADALGADNVLAVALPSPYSSKESFEDAKELADNLGCRFETIPIAELFATFSKNLAPLFAGRAEDVTEQNLQARIRGNLLMALSNKLGNLLLTTGNKSEMAVGYCTLYGDMNGGLAVISDVPKQLVYRLSEYRNRAGEVIPKRIITKPPSAELKLDQTDQDDLPPYDILDEIVELYLEEGQGLKQIIARGFAKDIVEDLLRRIRINEYKRKQAPMGLKVTSKAFGSGRRYPNVQNYRG